MKDSPTIQDRIMTACAAYAKQAQNVSEQIVFVTEKEKEYRSADTKLSNMKIELVKLKEAMDKTIEEVTKS